MALVFNGYELAALIFAALISTTVIADGESTWFEGVQLLGVYALLGLVFLRLRTTSSHGAQAPGGLRFNLMIIQAWQRTTSSRTPRRPNANAAILAPRIVSAW
jgi:hypothetical protein